MGKNKSWPLCLPLLLLTFVSKCTGQSNQLESPSGNEDGSNPYLAPELGRGIGTVNDPSLQTNSDLINQQQQKDAGNRRRYPDRSRVDSYGANFDPGSAFRNPGNVFRETPESKPELPQEKPPVSFGYDPYPTLNNSRSNVIITRRTTTVAPIVTSETTPRPGEKPTRSPFEDPNRYRIAQTREQSDQVRFVNGRPYK